MHLLFIKEAPANAAENGNSTDKNEVTQNKEKFFREYKGTVLGPNDMDEIESMEIREDDVFAVSFPRSGTTLTQELIYLVSTGDFERARTVILDDRFPFLDLALDGPMFPYYKGVKSIREKTSLRFIKSHLHHFLLPKQLREGKAKIIYIARIPKDVVFSYYKLRKWYKHEKSNFEEFFEDFLAGKAIMCGPWWRHVKESWDLKDRPNILFLKYEHIITNMHAVVKKISAFLGKILSDEAISRIVEHCQIGNMTNNPATNLKYQEDLMPKDGN